MHYSVRQRFWWWVEWLGLIISFCIIGFLLVSQATGYRYNRQLHRFQKTSMIIVSANPHDAWLELDRRQYSIGSTTRIPNILPGNYHLKITKAGYQAWTSDIILKPGFVVTVPEANLFLSQPVELDSAPYLNQIPFYQTEDDRIRISDGELHFGTQLVSRFGVAPTRAILLPTERHLVYIQNNEVRVIELTGEHDSLLYRGQQLDPKVLVFIGDVLVIKDGTAIKAFKIQ